MRHIVTNRLIVYVFCVTQGVTINSASHGGLTCAVKLCLGVVGAVIGGPPVAIFFTSTPQSNLRFASSPAGEPFGLPQSNLRFASSLSEGAFWHCTTQKLSPRAGKVARSAERGAAKNSRMPRVIPPQLRLRSAAPPHAVAPFGAVCKLPILSLPP